MDITLAILYLHPTLTDDDFMVLNDNQGEGDYIQWYNTEITQPTQAELDTAWASYSVEKIKQDDIDAFEACDTYIDKLESKIARLKARKSSPACTQENKDMIQETIDVLQAESDLAEIQLIAEMDAIKVKHGNLAVDYAEKIKKNCK